METIMKCGKCHTMKARCHNDYTDPQRVIKLTEPKTFLQKIYCKAKDQKYLNRCPKCNSLSIKITHTFDGK